jgi:hypothetical protein
MKRVESLWRWCVVGWSNWQLRSALGLQIPPRSELAWLALLPRIRPRSVRSPAAHGAAAAGRSGPVRTQSLAPTRFQMLGVPALVLIWSLGVSCTPDNEEVAMRTGGVAPTAGTESGGGIASGGTSSVDDGFMPEPEPDPGPPRDRCDSFPAVDPPCNEQVDLVNACPTGPAQFAFNPHLPLLPSPKLELVLLPLPNTTPGAAWTRLDGLSSGEGGGSSAEPLLLSLRSHSPVGSVESLGDDRFRILSDDAQLQFVIHGDLMTGYLFGSDSGFPPNARMATIALRAEEEIIQQRRVFFFDSEDCIE